jgi:hypothetical protein
VSLRTSGSGGRQQDFRKLPTDAVEREWGRLYQEYSEQLTVVTDEVAAGTTPSEEDLRKLSAPGLPLTRSVLQQVALLERNARALALQRLASALTLARLDYQFHVLQAELTEAARLAAASNQANEELERQFRAIDTLRSRLRALKEGQDNITAVLREIEQVSSEQRAASRARTPVVQEKAAGSLELGGGLRLKSR